MFQPIRTQTQHPGLCPPVPRPPSSTDDDLPSIIPTDHSELTLIFQSHCQVRLIKLLMEGEEEGEGGGKGTGSISKIESHDLRLGREPVGVTAAAVWSHLNAGF